MDLNTLLKNAVAQQAAGAAAKVGRKQLKDTRIGEKERNAIADKVREWESEADYSMVGLIWRAERVHCGCCGSVELGRGQVLIEQRHVRIAGTTRYIEARQPFPLTLPRRQVFVKVEVPVCAGCATEQGFQLPKES